MTPRDRFEELLDLWLDEALSPAERAEWNSLLAADESLRLEAEQEARLVALLRQAGERRAPEALLATALEKARQPLEIAELPPSERRRGNPWAFSSVAALLFVGLVVWALQQGGVDAPETQSGSGAGPQQWATMSNIAEPETAPETAPAAIPAAPIYSAGDLWRDKGQGTPAAPAATARTREIAPAPPAEPDALVHNRFVLEGPTDLSPEAKDTLQETGVLALSATTLAEPPPQPALENRAALERLVQNRRARVLADTRWRTTAEAIAGRRLALAETEPGDGMRYVVLEIPQVTSDVQALAFFEYKPDDAKDTRVVIAYRDAAAAPQVLARAAKATIAINSFDDFLAHMEQQGAQFLHYTADRELALKPYWKDETTALLDARALTPTPEPTPESERPAGFDGYIVFFLEDPETAARLLVELPNLSGDGIRNLDPSLAELITQPQGARLVIPYRIAD